MNREYLLKTVTGLTEKNIDSLLQETPVDYAPDKKTYETDLLIETIETNFPSAPFKNKDLSPLVKNLTARQIPSRLKKLVDSGHLRDLGGSPKSYQIN